jgi:hypothetical protein
MSGQQHAPAALYPRERPVTHFTAGWVGPRAGLDGRKRDLVISIVGTMTYSYYKWIIISCLSTYSSAMDMLQIVYLKLVCYIIVHQL